MKDKMIKTINIIIAYLSQKDSNYYLDMVSVEGKPFSARCTEGIFHAVHNEQLHRKKHYIYTFTLNELDEICAFTAELKPEMVAEVSSTNSTVGPKGFEPTMSSVELDATTQKGNTTATTKLIVTYDTNKGAPNIVVGPALTTEQKDQIIADVSTYYADLKKDDIVGTFILKDVRVRGSHHTLYFESV